MYSDSPTASVWSPTTGAHGRRAIIGLLVATLVVGALRLWPAPAIARSAPVAGNLLALPRGARVAGPLPRRYPLRLIIGLAPRHADLLATFLRLRSDPRSPLYGRTLTPAQFTTLFGATASAEADVAAYLRAHGLRVARTYRDHLLLDVTGTAGQAMDAFKVSLVRYRDRRGQLYYANAATPRLPVALAGLVTTIVGLRDDVAPHHAPFPHAPRRGAWTIGTARRSGRRTPHQPPAGLLTPSQLQTAYHIAPIYTQVFTTTTGITVAEAITGAGQTVALYELAPYNPADIAAYDAAFGITAPPPINVPVNGGALANKSSGAGIAEAAMDIELVRAIAPGARILVYNGPSSDQPAHTTNTGADDVYARIINDGYAQVLSTSWGDCEDAQQADLKLLHALFAQAVAEGMTVVAASGDNGAYDCLTSQGTPDGTRQTVDYPASDPYVIAVGGTNLAADGNGAVLSEEGWSGSGGGLSHVFAQPSWQAGPGVAADAGDGKRQVPDVALNAGMRYAVWVADGWSPVNGTSAGPPVWAGLLALVNQTRYTVAAFQGAPTPSACAHLPGLGDIHPELYSLGAVPGPVPAFRDITAGGSNGVATPGPGWDGVTGWGVPDAYALLQALVATPALAAPTPAPCPTATLVPSATPTRAAVTMTPTPVPAATSTPTRPSPSNTPTRPSPSSTPARRRPTPTPRPGGTPTIFKRLVVRVTPARVRMGGQILLELAGATGRGRKVIFEAHYPGRLQLLLRLTDNHGVAMARLRVPRGLLSRGGMKDRLLVVEVRATIYEQGLALSKWTTFRVVT